MVRTRSPSQPTPPVWATAGVKAEEIRKGRKNFGGFKAYLEGICWRSFPCKNPKEKQRKTYEKIKKNLRQISNNYAPMLIVVAFLVVNIFSFLIIASWGAWVKRWTIGRIFLLGFLYLPIPTRTLNSSNKPQFLTPEILRKHRKKKWLLAAERSLFIIFLGFPLFWRLHSQA